MQDLRINTQISSVTFA